MTKRQLIEDIQSLNPTAATGFLGQFADGDLKEYLEHLRDAQAKRLRISGWVKRKPKMRLVS